MNFNDIKVNDIIAIACHQRNVCWIYKATVTAVGEDELGRWVNYSSHDAGQGRVHEASQPKPYGVKVRDIVGRARPAPAYNHGWMVGHPSYDSMR